jgi:sodium/potassium/calcium exchanger 6
VTLLALGNGASDVISSLVASTDTDGVEFSIGALIGSGVFVTSFVLGLVVYYGNGIKVNAVMFNRDILLYLLSLLMLVVIGVRGRISYVESLCFLSVYVVNVALAFVQDRQMKTKDKEGDIEEGIELVESEDGVLKEESSKDSEDDVFRERGNILPLKVITEMKSDQLGK